MESKLQKYINEIAPLDTSGAERIQKRLDNLTKPHGSLGMLETLAMQVCLIAGSDNPSFRKRKVFIMAGDSGVVAEGVSAYPQEVTPQMVYNFLNNGAGINVLSKANGFDIEILDIGIAFDIETDDPRFINRKVAYGTENFTKGPSMTREQAAASVLAGVNAVREDYEKNGLEMAATGDMGIGNTTPSSAIVSAITGAAPEHVTGYGTGISDTQLQNKIDVIKRGISANNPDPKDGLDVLSKVGSYDIGGIAGVIIGAASVGIPVIVDGFISQAGALVAATMCPDVLGYVIPSHQSVEKGSQAIWSFLGLRPYLNLGMRLGEGTGAVLMAPLIESSVKILNEMSSFESAGVSEKS